MKYELAKQLKDAGFPMHLKKNWNMNECPYQFGIFLHNDGEEYLFPTISELIEACGDNFKALDRYNEAKWFAYSHTVSSDRAETPEEAVAKLWLELNK